MEQVAHVIDENPLRRFPLQRKLQHLWLKGQFKAIAVVCLAHRLEAVCHSLRVAVFATGADFGAAGHRVPCRVGPFDGGIRGHKRCSVLKMEDILQNFASTQEPLYLFNELTWQFPKRPSGRSSPTRRRSTKSYASIWTLGSPFSVRTTSGSSTWTASLAPVAISEESQVHR